MAFTHVCMYMYVCIYVLSFTALLHTSSYRILTNFLHGVNFHKGNVAMVAVNKVVLTRPRLLGENKEFISDLTNCLQQIDKNARQNGHL